MSTTALPLFRVPCPRCRGTGLEKHRYARCHLCDGEKLVASREAPPGAKKPRKRALGPQGVQAVAELAEACQRLADSLRRARP